MHQRIFACLLAIIPAYSNWDREMEACFAQLDAIQEEFSNFPAMPFSRLRRECCNLQAGPRGNEMCWSGPNTFERCCRVARLPWRTLGFLREDPVAYWAALETRAKRTIQVLQVGAAGGDFSNESTDVAQRIMRDPLVRAVLVEPLPARFRELQRSISAAFGKTDRLRAIQAVVSDAKLANTSFFVLDTNRLLADFPGFSRRSASVLLETSSMDRSHLVKHLEKRSPWLAQSARPGLQLERDRDSSSVWLGYIQEIMVRCLTPADLLAEVGLAPRQIDVLQIDAEGFDMKILFALLALPEMEPSVIRYEWRHAPPEEFALSLGLLRSRGYAVTRVGEDAVAVHESSALQLRRAPELPWT